MDFVKFLISICLLLSRVECDIQFQYDSGQCLNQPVEYQCTVTGSGLQVLTWKVYTDNGIQIGSDVAFISSANQAPDTIGGVFTVEQLSQSPLISNISFTVQSSINGYTIICEDGNTFSNSTLELDVFVYSGNVTIHTDTFTNTSVSISWTESSPYCGPVIYRYNISSEPELVESVTNDNVIVGDLVPSDDPYCITVNVIYTYDTTRTTNEQCFLFQVPNPVQIVIATNETESNTTNVTVEWEESVDFNVQNQNTVTPPFMNYLVTLFNLTDGGPVSYDSGLLSPDTSTYTFTGVSQGRIYTVTVEAINGVGKSNNTTSIEVPGIFIPTVPSSSSSSITPSSTSTTSSTPARSPSISSTTSSSTTTVPPSVSPAAKKTGLGAPAIVGIVAGAVIFLLVVTVVVLVIVYCVWGKKDSGSASAPVPLKETHSASRAQPETGQVTYEDTPGVKVQHKQAPTGELYAEPDVKNSGRRAPPQPTYQDPNTIQRQQAPTGDMYAMPEKKPAYSQVKKPGPGEVYADLDMSSVSPRSPQPLIPSESQQQQQVLYSDVRHH